MSYSPCPVAKQTTGWRVAQRAQDAERDLAVVGGDHLDAIGRRRAERGVVEPHAEAAGARRIAVDVDRLDGEDSG